MEPIVSIENLTKIYETGFWKKKKVQALDDVSLRVNSGQIFGFLGGNGAGKTTTIKILMGLLYPSSGSASILGKNITDFKMHRVIGYCPENPYFYDYLTPRELLNYFGDLFGIEQSKRKSKSEELLTRVGLEEKDWNKQLRKFSKRMMLRVGLAQSLINDPEIVFMDEPMSGLDPVGRREVRELISELRVKGTTVFMSTHILSDVETLCDEVAILRKGRLAATGKLDDLLAAGSENQIFEVILRGVSSAVVQNEIGSSDDVSIAETPNGLKIQVAKETSIDKVIEASRRNGGKLVSVQSVKQSLEELFVRETS